MTEFRSKGKGKDRKVYPIKSEKLSGAYYESRKYRTPLDAINEILRDAKKGLAVDAGEIEFFENGRPVKEDKIKKSAEFQVLMTNFDGAHTLSGTVSRTPHGWVAGGELESI
ncbi:MAG: hypothetical protein JRN26_04660 [Nitrososphaerota archaeon]|nr:hypothetical protein [Nitrososphaerota archaeon]MDG6927850.1 hypothetical protein [Nitrososphaerota archaeon]MDG6931278.1 hypothetical protein [Nitrososphaerota archaeon]MDG6932145.1 hypothetical protein [Nitrososphaerota archaeon]MDG6936156.1 hypothetical protein [Nitrososphaerota archaeon]